MLQFNRLQEYCNIKKWDLLFLDRDLAELYGVETKYLNRQEKNGTVSIFIWLLLVNKLPKLP